MPNSIATYTDAQIMRALLTRNFSGIGNEFIDDTITTLKPAAFMEATNLSKVSLPALKTVRTLAFQNTNIATLDLPWSTLESIGYCAFMGAANVPQNLTLSRVTALANGAFAGTTSSRNTQIRTVSLPLWTGSSLTEGSGFSNSNMGIFAYCTAMTSFSAPELLTVPNQMLYYCMALENVVLPKVTSLGTGSFNGCSNLIKLDIGGNVTKINSAFINSCSSLEAVIFRGVTAVPTVTSASLNSSPVATSSNCYVYVPQSLEASFKVASVWSTYAGKIRAIEDYPAVCGS